MTPIANNRTGGTVWAGTSTNGHFTFVPHDLPPDPPLQFDGEMVTLLSQADQAIGNLSGVARSLPNPDLFVAMYVRKEAVLSSQIEGIQCTLDEILQVESAQTQGQAGIQSKDVEEVVNYVNAMNYGIELLSRPGEDGGLPLCLRLLLEIHERLLHGVRGSTKTPGEFRRSNNWIGVPSATISNAAFVPPPVKEMTTALQSLEGFMQAQEIRATVPVLIQCAMVHAQFETIHPFLDGNGRLGRLLVSLLLHERGTLTLPLLYISLYLKKNKLEYYEQLTKLRQHGSWESWTKFFVRGVAEVADEAVRLAQQIVALQEQARAAALTMGRHESSLVDLLFRHPILDARFVEHALGCSFTTAQNALQNLESAGFVKETTGKKRGRIYRFESYLNLLERDEDPQPIANMVEIIDAVPSEAEVEVTGSDEDPGRPGL